MPIDHDDLDAFARRVGLHFEARLRPMAISIASYLAPELGSRLKQLRPETPMRELLGWLNTSLGGGPNSLEWVEFFIALEEELRCRIDDTFAEKLEQSTFGELVEHLHKNQRSAA